MRGACQGGQGRVGPGAAVVEPRGGDVANAPAGAEQPRLPVLLVPVEVERRVEAADPVKRGPPDRHVRAPHPLGVAVLGAEVEEGDRGALAPAGRQGPLALQPGADRAAEGVVAG